MADGTRLNGQVIAAPYTVDKQDFFDVLFPRRTTTQIQDATDRINTEDKFAGRVVFNTTTGLPAFASGATPTSVWNSADITVGVDLTPS